MRERRQIERVLGYGVVVLLFGGTLALLSTRTVRAQVGRVAQTVIDGFADTSDRDQVRQVASLDGIEPGLPLYRVSESGDTSAVGHVVSTNAAAREIRLRPAPGQSLAGLKNLKVFAPSQKLGDAITLAVPPEAAKAFAEDVAGRLEALWLREVLPDVKQRLPAFVERIDPIEDTEASKLLKNVSSDVADRTKPIVDELLTHVVSAVKDKLGVLDKLGLLWDMLRGNEKEIRDALMPTAKKAATAWWNDNQARVLTSLGDGISENWPEIRTWLSGELLDALLDELVKPVFAANRRLLETEAERIMRDAVRAFVEAPGGGFRVRFSSLLRHNLLDKRTALLLWIPDVTAGG